MGESVAVIVDVSEAATVGMLVGVGTGVGKNKAQPSVKKVIAAIKTVRRVDDIMKFLLFAYGNNRTLPP
jgi:hypothetical protein